ncbi:MAG: hypothetical protein MMC33_009104 [Icmadophila ericetorum]|nr:hypothetical protein [Icmadophila ericetorum]
MTTPKKYRMPLPSARTHARSLSAEPGNMVPAYAQPASVSITGYRALGYGTPNNLESGYEIPSYPASNPFRPYGSSDTNPPETEAEAYPAATNGSSVMTAAGRESLVHTRTSLGSRNPTSNPIFWPYTERSLQPNVSRNPKKINSVLATCKKRYETKHEAKKFDQDLMQSPVINISNELLPIIWLPSPNHIEKHARQHYWGDEPIRQSIVRKDSRDELLLFLKELGVSQGRIRLEMLAHGINNCHNVSTIWRDMRRLWQKYDESGEKLDSTKLDPNQKNSSDEGRMIEEWLKAQNARNPALVKPFVPSMIHREVKLLTLDISNAILRGYCTLNRRRGFRLLVQLPLAARRGKEPPWQKIVSKDEGRKSDKAAHVESDSALDQHGTNSDVDQYNTSSGEEDTGLAENRMGARFANNGNIVADVQTPAEPLDVGPTTPTHGADLRNIPIDMDLTHLSLTPQTLNSPAATDQQMPAQIPNSPIEDQHPAVDQLLVYNHYPQIPGFYSYRLHVRGFADTADVLRYFMDLGPRITIHQVTDEPEYLLSTTELERADMLMREFNGQYGINMVMTAMYIDGGEVLPVALDNNPYDMEEEY